MKRTRNRLLTAGLAALLTAAGLFVFVSGNNATPAQAAPGCVGAACNGKDPDAMGCAVSASSVTKLGAVAPSGVPGQMYVVYSPVCKAAWALIKATGPWNIQQPALQLWQVGPTGGMESLLYSVHVACTCGDPAPPGSLYSVFTPMQEWSGSLKACSNWHGGATTEPDPTGTGQSTTGDCTGWF